MEPEEVRNVRKVEEVWNEMIARRNATPTHVKMCGPFLVAWCKGMFWFRIFGYGLHFKDVTKHPVTMHERNGISRVYRLRNWGMKVLRRN